MRSYELLPLDGFGSAVPSFQMHQVFRGILKQVPSNDATVHDRPLYDDQRRHIPFAGLAFPIVHGGHGDLRNRAAFRQELLPHRR